MSEERERRHEEENDQKWGNDRGWREVNRQRIGPQEEDKGRRMDVGTQDEE